MVQFRLGQTDAARKTFNAAKILFMAEVDKATKRDAWIFHLLHREAESVLAGEP